MLVVVLATAAVAVLLRLFIDDDDDVVFISVVVVVVLRLDVVGLAGPAVASNVNACCGVVTMCGCDPDAVVTIEAAEATTLRSKRISEMVRPPPPPPPPTDVAVTLVEDEVSFSGRRVTNCDGFEC